MKNWEASHMQESDMNLSLSSDTTRIAQLREKLAEYTERTNLDVYADDIDGLFEQAKRMILEHLFERHEIHFKKECAYFTTHFGNSFEHAIVTEVFSEAYEVIRDYCETGGIGLEGGHLPLVTVSSS